MVVLPGDIERTSMAIIQAELSEMGIEVAPENRAVILRCIHASADFDYAGNLFFTPDACRLGAEALKRGTPIITDTNMSLAGISRAGLKKLGCGAFCFMADEAVAERAREEGTTRAAAAMDCACREYPGAVLAVGNAPTALLRLAEHIEAGYVPALVLAFPVGFVHVVESKEKIAAVCQERGIPLIAAMGRKGGSTIATAALNALIYTAADMLEPGKRGWI